MGVRIRPASALCVILTIAFGLHLVAVLSAPITKAIPLCISNNIQYGVFGYCDTVTGVCSKVGIGYGDALPEDGFKLALGARKTLSNLLIAHVVAAGLTLVLLVMTLFAHLHTASHSSGYLWAIVGLSVPCFLISLLAFLVDILLFTPRLAWGGWIVLAATILILFFIIMMCVMRRKMASRKAHKAQNSAELHNLNAPLEYVPAGVASAFTEKSTINSSSIGFTKYDTGAPQGSFSDVALHKNVSYQSETSQPFLAATSTPDRNYNRYENNAYMTPPPQASTPVRDNRAAAAAYAQYRGTPPSDYSASNYTNHPEFGSHGAPVTAAAAVVAASSQQQPRRRDRQSVALPDGIIPAGTYVEGYAEDGTSPNMGMDSYSDYGNSVVSVPQIRNPGAIRTYSSPGAATAVAGSNRTNLLLPPPLSASGAAQRSGPRTYDAQPMSADDTPASSRMLPQPNDEYGQPAEPYSDNAEYNPPRPAWRQQYSGQSAQSAPEYRGAPQPQQQNQGQNMYNNSSSSRSARSNSSSTTNPNRSHHALRQQYLDEDDAYDTNYGNPQYANQPMMGTAHDEPYAGPTDNTYTNSNNNSNARTNTSTSPALSDLSHFTSISQREPNPRYYQGQQQQQQPRRPDATEMMLASNPDFQLPATRNKKQQQQQKQNQNQSALNPGFGSLDGPYGAVRGMK